MTARLTFIAFILAAATIEIASRYFAVTKLRQDQPRTVEVCD